MDGYGNADEISLGNFYYGNIKDSSDKDWFKFNLPKSGYVSFSFGKEFVNHNGNLWDLYLYDKNINKITNYSFSGGNKNTENTSKLKLPAGTYYIKIQGSYSWAWTMATYKLRVNCDFTKYKPFLSITSSTQSAKLSWGKISGASGYEVYRSTTQKGTYKKVKTITSGSTKKYTDSNLTSNKKYYYKVRAYKTVSGKKYYSSFSSVKFATVK